MTVGAILWSARVPRAGERVSRSRTLREALISPITEILRKDCFGATPTAARGTRGLPRAERRGRYFFTISAFSSMAMPPRSASLPFNVIVFPQ